MALIKCPECGKEISDKAEACPNCGCPAAEFLKTNTEIENIYQDIALEKSNSIADSSSSEFVTEQNSEIEVKNKKIGIMVIALCCLALIVSGVMMNVNKDSVTANGSIVSSSDSQLSEKYSQAVNALKSKDVMTARTLISEIKQANPNYQDIETLALYEEAFSEYTYYNSPTRYGPILTKLNEIDKSYSGTLRSDIDNLYSKVSLDKKTYEALNDDKEKQSKFIEERKSTPLDISVFNYSQNSIGTPELSFTAKNTSSKTIDAFNVIFFCYDNFNNPVNHYLYNNNLFKGIGQQKIAAGGTFNGKDSRWTVYGYENTTKFIAVITDVHFTDNTVWEMSADSILQAKKYADESIKDYSSFVK